MAPSTTEASATVEQQLRAVRDRFVGFAFAGGDLLLEIDDRGVIHYAVGAARHMTGHPARDLVGRALGDLVRCDGAGELAPSLATLMAERRVGPLEVVLGEQGGGRRVWLAGHRAEAAPRAQLSLRVVPTETASTEPPLPDRARFEQELLDHLARGEDGERLTLLDLSALEAMGERLDAGQMSALRAEIGTQLRDLSAGDDGAGWLADDTVGVIHGPELDPTQVDERMRWLTQEADPTGAGVPMARATVEMDTTGLSATDAGQALLYAINRFAETRGGEFDIHSLREGLDAMVEETVGRLAEYRGTVRAESFDLVFQPIIDLRTRKVHHHELLTRLANGRSPFEMVTFAERLGTVAEFDLAVCRRVLDLFAERPGASAGIAVNLSARSLESDLFTRALLALLDDHPDHRGRLLFELTESAAILAPDRVARVLAALRRRGIAICLDDFGSGAAAFHYLRAFRFDHVKIDGEYIKSTDRRDHAILRGIVGMCRDLGVKTVAEMVETPLQAERLRRLGVDLGQGYLFGRPGPLPEPATAGPARQRDDRPRPPAVTRAHPDHGSAARVGHVAGPSRPVSP